LPFNFKSKVMQSRTISFQLEEYQSDSELAEADASLLQKARDICKQAYAPYSGFGVGAVALLANNEIISGTNQENASYPVGVCAERALLATAGTLYPGIPIVKMALSYEAGTQPANGPITPCGMCRQALKEFEMRTGSPVCLIMSGQEGPVWIIRESKNLLPLAFGKRDLPEH
jgi:cytidine deaminase